jgi:hypothetical protein
MFDRILGVGQPINDLPHYHFISMCGQALRLADLSGYFLYRFPIFVVGSAHTPVFVELYDTCNYLRTQQDMHGLMPPFASTFNVRVLDYV